MNTEKNPFPQGDIVIAELHEGKFIVVHTVNGIVQCDRIEPKTGERLSFNQNELTNESALVREAKTIRKGRMVKWIDGKIEMKVITCKRICTCYYESDIGTLHQVEMPIDLLEVTNHGIVLRELLKKCEKNSWLEVIEEQKGKIKKAESYIIA